MQLLEIKWSNHAGHVKKHGLYFKNINLMLFIFKILVYLIIIINYAINSNRLLKMLQKVLLPKMKKEMFYTLLNYLMMVPKKF